MNDFINPLPNLFKTARPAHCWDSDQGQWFVEHGADYGCWDNGDAADGYHFPSEPNRICASFSILWQRVYMVGWAWEAAWQDATGNGGFLHFDTYADAAAWIAENIWTDDRGRLRIGLGAE